MAATKKLAIPRHISLTSVSLTEISSLIPKVRDRISMKKSDGYRVLFAMQKNRNRCINFPDVVIL